MQSKALTEPTKKQKKRLSADQNQTYGYPEQEAWNNLLMAVKSHLHFARNCCIFVVQRWGVGRTRLIPPLFCSKFGWKKSRPCENFATARWKKPRFFWKFPRVCVQKGFSVLKKVWCKWKLNLNILKKIKKTCPVKHSEDRLSHLDLAKWAALYARALFRAPRARALF